MEINLFGERNTGTNWLASLLKTAGLPAHVGDKHMFRAKTRGNIDKWGKPLTVEEYINEFQLEKARLNIYLSKNPLSWLKSMNRQPYHLHGLTEIIDGTPCNIPMSEFLTRKACEYGGKSEDFHKGNPCNRLGDYKNILEIRNEKNRFFQEISLRLTNCKTVKYENLLFKMEKTLLELGLGVELQSTDEYFTGFHRARGNPPSSFSEKQLKILLFSPNLLF